MTVKGKSRIFYCNLCSSGYARGQITYLPLNYFSEAIPNGLVCGDKHAGSNIIITVNVFMGVPAVAKLVDALKPSLYSFISISACFLVISAARDFIPKNLTAFLLFFLASTVMCMVVAGCVSIVTK